MYINNTYNKIYENAYAIEHDYPEDILEHHNDVKGTATLVYFNDQVEYTEQLIDVLLSNMVEKKKDAKFIVKLWRDFLMAKFNQTEADLLAFAKIVCASNRFKTIDMEKGIKRKKTALKTQKPPHGVESYKDTYNEFAEMSDEDFETLNELFKTSNFSKSKKEVEAGDKDEDFNRR